MKYILVYTMFLHNVIKALDSHHVAYAIVGGYAVALHGAVRGTVDLDIVLKLSETQFEAAEKALKSMGLESRLPVTAKQVFQFREEYIRNRNLVAWNFYNPNKASELVDIIITQDLSKIKIKKVRSGKTTLKVASIEDLIRMKTDSGRPQDIEDVKALKALS